MRKYSETKLVLTIDDNGTVRNLCLLLFAEAENAFSHFSCFFFLFCPKYNASRVKVSSDGVVPSFLLSKKQLLLL